MNAAKTERTSIHDWPFSMTGYYNYTLIPNTMDYNCIHGINEWLEVDEEIYYNQLGAVPPLEMNGPSFMVGEEWSNGYYATFTCVNKRYFGKMCKPKDFNFLTFKKEILAQLEMEN